MNHFLSNLQIPVPARRPVNGIICFGGEDWWYHNRGHYDMRMMQELATQAPVLYVNSVGMRVPSAREGRVFLKRISRKLKSMSRGVRRVDESFAVMSVPVIPGGWGLSLTRSFASQRILSTAGRLSISRPLVWIACPTGAEFVESLGPAAVVYQRTDRYEEFSGVDATRIQEYDKWLKARADVTVFCSSYLYEEERDGCRNATLIDHGVDVNRFSRTMNETWQEPPDLANVPRPRVGFVGGIDAHTFDPQLFNEIVQRRPSVQFVLVGATTLPQGWCEAGNVFQLGQRPLEKVADYMRACDVLIMPWTQSRWIEACNPVKLKEYLASGRPIVSTPFPELKSYSGLVSVAKTAMAFADHIDQAIQCPGDARLRRAHVSDQTWASKCKALLTALGREKITLQSPSGTDVALNPFELVTQTAAESRASRLAEIRDEHVVVAQSRNQMSGGPAQSAVMLETKDNSRWRRGTKRKANSIDTCLILAGSLRPSPLARLAGCSVLDLPLTSERTVLEMWLDRIGEIGKYFDDDPIVRVSVDGQSPPPVDPRGGSIEVRFETERTAYRGPAGVIADACRGLPGDARVLVIEGLRYAGAELSSVLEAHFDRDEAVTVVRNGNGTLGGVYVVRAEALRQVPCWGFMDLKEQWIPRILSQGWKVGAQSLPMPGIVPVRTLRQLLRASALACGAASGGKTTRVVCPGAFIGPDSIVMDSIIMPGAIIESGAIVARSLICSEARVSTGAKITDEVWVRTGELSGSWTQTA